MQHISHVEVQDLSQEFSPSGKVLDHISLSVPKGQFVTLLGPSGSGKTTLLRLIAGLIHPTQGTVRVHEAKPYDRAYVFQEPYLMPWRNVLRNVTLPLELMGISQKQQSRLAQEALELVGLEKTEEMFPHELSGGMKMRVSLARALVIKPDLLLLDEPLGSLDESLRFHLGAQLRRIWEEQNMTVILVTHSLAEATFMSDRALIISPKPAKIIADLQINLPRVRPVSLRTTSEYAQEFDRVDKAFHNNERRDHS